MPEPTLDELAADASITPPWYPSGQHQSAIDVLELLIAGR
jgi:hypothetical protein